MPTAPPTQEAFERLLLSINPDRERAGEEYELLRLKLIKYFNLRGCLGAEELADETLNRLAKKVAQGEEIRELIRYCYGLARWICVEYHRNPQSKPVPFENVPIMPVVIPDPLVEKERLKCLHHCLGELTVEEKDMIIKYCDDSDQPHQWARRDLVEQMNISPTALRIRVSRIKKKLKACYYDCLEHGLTNLKRT
jgi:DNA-directed RNA polymerase specialized sigma24 family protein